MQWTENTLFAEVLRQIVVLRLGEYGSALEDLLPEVPSNMLTMWQKYFPEPDPRLCGSESHQNFCCIEAPIKKRRKISSLDVNLWDPVKSSPHLELFK